MSRLPMMDQMQAGAVLAFVNMAILIYNYSSSAMRGTAGMVNVVEAGAVDAIFPEQQLRLMGARIKQQRQALDLSLTTLAEMTGLGLSTLSRIEHGTLAPGFVTLLGLCRHLRLPVAEVFKPEPQERQILVATNPLLPKNLLARKEIRCLLDKNAEEGVAILSYLYRPGAASSPHPLTHPGYEYGYVVEGELTVEIDGRSHVLEPGDLIGYESRRPHRTINRGRRMCSAIWLTAFNRKPSPQR
ncbi:cupin domain-containing protein [Rhizobium sp. TRM96650]|uniref:cupin domain-containing protein n=2 Tax=unclassified Rhizobium TaxID=2613769 RepID=UPI0021E7F959|nr:cupin domain-containing protein [Rhizobium sp. TRM96650]MCV3758063.1 cupin domain-containing protein [Rhizobium sp. TRM96650]